MSEPLSESELHRRWERTLGDRGFADADPLATHKPAEDAGTLSGLATVGGAAATLSGGATLGGTLSGAGTVAPEGAAAGAGRGTGYELVGELGRGGMGVVFRARQRALARDIALKFIKPDQAGPATRERFISEALVNGLLDHPNIVPVHDLGTDERGEVYLAMKLVGGRSWKALLHPATPEERAAAAACDLDRHLAILQGVGNAVAFAHSRGIVHRDLKPENVMVGEFGEILVMDWGIAVDVRDTPDGDQRAQHKSTVAAPSGTPSYMAPELAEGRGRDIGPWTDVYLLGAILHEILTGRPPHRGRTLMEVLLAASRSAAPAWDAGVPAGLAAVAARALDRDPARRFPTVADFQAAVAAWLKHRESERIADSARARLNEAEAMAAGDAGARSRRYAAFAEAVAGFRQALVLWDGNAAAGADERRARLAYARAALAGGDLGLADAQLEPLPGDGDGGLRGEVAAARTAATARERAAARNRWLLAGAGVAIVAGLGIGFAVVSAERDATAAERDKAVAAEAEARRQEGMARSEGERARREQQAAESARREMAGRFAQNAAAEARHAAGSDDDGAALLWFAEAIDRDPDGPGVIGWRTAIAGVLSGLPRPFARMGTFISSSGTSADEDYAIATIRSMAPTGRRDRVLVLLYHVPQMPSGPAPEASWTSVAVWDPSAGGSLAGQDAGRIQSMAGWVVGPRGRQVLLVSPQGWELVDLSGPEARSVAITAAPDVEGEAIRELQFSPDGGWLWRSDATEIRRWSTKDLAEAPAIALPAGGAAIGLSADRAWCWHHRPGGIVVRSTATWAEVPFPAEVAGLSLLMPLGDQAIAQTSRGWMVLARSGQGWAAVGPLAGPGMARIAGNIQMPALSPDGRHLTWFEQHSVRPDGFRAEIQRSGATLVMGPAVRTDGHPWATARLAERLGRLVGAQDNLAVDEAGGLAVAWNHDRAVAFDLHRQAMPAPVVQVALAASAAHLPAPASIIAVPYRDADGTVVLPDGRRVAVQVAEDLASGQMIPTARDLLVVARDSIVVHPHAGGQPRSIPLPVLPEQEGSPYVTPSADGGMIAVVRSVPGTLDMAVWVLRIDGTPVLGPVTVPAAPGIPSADGRLLALPDGTVAELPSGATRAWRAGDPVAVPIGDRPTLVRDPLALVSGGFEPVASVFVREARTGRARVLRIGRDGDLAARCWATVGVYDGPEAAGPERQLASRIVFSAYQGNEPSADLSPDGRRVVVLHEPDGVLAIHAADGGASLARIEVLDLFPPGQALWPTRVQWVDDRRVRLEGQVVRDGSRQDAVAVVTLPVLDDDSERLALKISAFALRSLTYLGEIGDPLQLDEAVKAWAR
ncbi:MAG: hypothetical protein RLZZ127_481 [Planctomycetota bacterium]|jgi:hypothetical protein